MYESPSVKFQQEWFKEKLNSTMWDLKTKSKEFAEALNEPIIVPAYKKVLKQIWGVYLKGLDLIMKYTLTLCWLFPICLCNGPSVFAIGGSTSRTDFLETRVQQSVLFLNVRELLETTCWKVLGLETTKKVSLYTEYGKLMWTKTNISEICLLWKEAGDTDRHEKIRKELLPNVSKILVVFFPAVSLKWMARQLQSV